MPNLIEILNQHNVPFRQHGEHHHTSIGWISVDCPYCSPNSSRFRLGLEISTGRTNCWACGLKNRVNVISQICSISISESINLCKDAVEQLKVKRKHQGVLKIPERIHSMFQCHRKYLSNRGLDPNSIEKLWKVKGIGLESHLKWRLFIPIFDRYGDMVSWTTRSINPNNEKRYISAKSSEESVPHKSILYGAHLARQSIIIVEGPLDAWAIGPGSVATCGISFSTSQLIEMTQYQNRTICFDIEETAQRRARSLYRKLSEFPGETENAILETGTDPAEADAKEIEELRLCLH